MISQADDREAERVRAFREHFQHVRLHGGREVEAPSVIARGGEAGQADGVDVVDQPEGDGEQGFPELTLRPGRPGPALARCRLWRPTKDLVYLPAHLIPGFRHGV